MVKSCLLTLRGRRCGRAGRMPPSASAFQDLCAAVPALHASALRLLQALLQVCALLACLLYLPPL